MVSPGMLVSGVLISLCAGVLGFESGFGKNLNGFNNIKSLYDRSGFRTDKIDLIFPGTKWCGAGDISADYNDLGPNREADICCRAHDHCEDYILAKSTDHGLTNDAPYTRVNCDCDQNFFSCLKKAADSGDAPSRMVAHLYFNMLETQCFKEDYPVIDCDRYPNSKRCQVYYLDHEAPKVFQWFDVPMYT